MADNLLLSCSLWKEPLFIPIYLSAFSAFVLVVQLILRTKRVQRLLNRFRPSKIDTTVSDDRYNTPSPPQYTGLIAETKQRIKQQGGLTAFVLKVARVLACLALLAISIVAFVQYEGQTEEDSLLANLKKGWGKHGKKKHHKDQERRREYIHHAEWIEVAQCAFYVSDDYLLNNWRNPHVWNSFPDIYVTTCAVVSHPWPSNAGKGDIPPSYPLVRRFLHICVS